MDVIIRKKILEFNGWKINALCFESEDTSKKRNAIAAFTHGYTDHKASILNWGIKLGQIGIPTILFDLPGHYLSSFNDVDDFEDFSKKIPHLFTHAAQTIMKMAHLDNKAKLILGGHSLGGLLALIASKNDQLTLMNKQIICVGLGMQKISQDSPLYRNHFYQNIWETRAQLVSPALHPKNVFPWIREMKNEHTIHNTAIHLISGKDDVMLGINGAKNLKEHLEELDNHVTLDEPESLPHHKPMLAGSLIKRFILNNKIV